MCNMDETNKKLIITGKNNIHKMTEILNNEKVKAIRNKMGDLNDDLLLAAKQVDMINNMYINEDNNTNKYKVLLKQELEKKINGYKQQDINKDIYNPQLLITLDALVEKIVISKLKCFYCMKSLYLLYKNVREPNQWTLDRKDNDKCHSIANTVVCCLKCNLDRRVKNMDKFIFTKKLRIKKEI